MMHWPDYFLGFSMGCALIVAIAGLLGLRASNVVIDEDPNGTKPTLQMRRKRSDDEDGVGVAKPGE